MNVSIALLLRATSLCAIASISGELRASAGDLCEFPDANCQIADQSGGRISSAGVVVCADDFQLARFGCCGGDTSGDGLVNMFDVDPFVDALRTGAQLCEADVNCSGHVDNFDIDAFVEVVVNGTCSPCSGGGPVAWLSSLCWSGATIAGKDDATAFRVVIYESINGAPGEVLCGPFQQSDNTLTVESILTGEVIDGVHPERAYHARHNFCAVEREQCFWLEISNTSENSTWLWEFATPGNSTSWRDGVFTVGDFAFCLGDDLIPGTACPPP